MLDDLAHAPETSPPRPPQFSDEALALRFAALHADDLRYVAALGQWFGWDGMRWKCELTLKAVDHARSVCRAASAECNNLNDGKAIASLHAVNAVERLARADRRLAATTDQWDCDPWLLNTPGGTIALRTGVMREARREDYCTRVTSATPAAGCPHWLKFLDRIMDGDQDSIRFLARMFGYSLTGVTNEHAMLFLHGQGCNGKSVLVGALSEAFGDYGQTAATDTFMASKHDRPPTELADLAGARLVVGSEAERERHWNEARLKRVTGGDRVKARFMQKDFFEFTPQFKLVIVGNHKPSFAGVNYAIRRRLHLIAFNVIIPPDEVDKTLPDKLRQEYPGILQWAIDDCLEWQQVGLSPPPSVREATESYLNQEDTVGQWLEAYCQRSAGSVTPFSELWTSWLAFAESVGEHPGSKKNLARELEARGFLKARTGQSRNYAGVILKRQEGAG